MLSAPEREHSSLAIHLVSKEFLSLARSLQLDVQLTSHPYHPRDAWVFAHDGSLISPFGGLPELLVNEQRALFDTAMGDCVEQMDLAGFNRSSIPLIRAIPGQLFNHLGTPFSDYERLFANTPKRPLVFLAEGGNLLQVTNNKGRVKLFLGAFQEASTTRALKALGMDVDFLGNVAGNFALEREDVFILPQVFYHLDYYLKSGPDHSFLLYNPNSVITLLSELLEKPLSTKERVFVDAYINTARLVAKELGSLLFETKRLIKIQGFTVHDTPGIFFGIPGSAFNLMSALSGKKPNGKRYYITTGAGVGSLGQRIMDRYTKFLHTIDKELEVYYLGGPEFTEPMTWWNSQFGQFGLHCLTLELP